MAPVEIQRDPGRGIKTSSFLDDSRHLLPIHGSPTGGYPERWKEECWRLVAGKCWMNILVVE